MAEPTAPCVHCGAVLPIAALLQVDFRGAVALACADCAPELAGASGSARGARR